MSAFAQSSVVLDGYFDRGLASVNNNYNQKDARTLGSNAGTTTVGIKVREDLGGGLSAGGWISTDWNDLGGAKQTDITGGGTQRTGFANSQNFVDLTSAQFGTLRLGTPNSFTLTNATSVAAPAFSTGIGSSYSTNFSVANGLGTGTDSKGGIVDAAVINSTTGSAGQRAIRINNTVQYSSPVVAGGLSAHVSYSVKNDNDNLGNKLVAATSTTFGNTVGVTEYALRYANGPIDAMYTSIKYSVGANKVNAGGGAITANSTTGSLTTSLTSTQDMLGATYTVMPSLKLHAGFGTFSSSNDVYKGKSQQFGATYTMGQFDIMGQIAKVDDQATTDMDRKVTGLGVNYNLSKTSRVYFRYDSINYASGKAGGTQVADTAALAGSLQKRSAIGISKSF